MEIQTRSSGPISSLAVVSLLLKDLKQRIDFLFLFFFSRNFHLIRAFKSCPAFILHKVTQLNTLSPHVSAYSVKVLIHAAAKKHTNNSDQLVMEHR